MKFLVLIIITILIFTNAITDAPNAIATLVGTKVMNFRKAAKLSAIFNLIGIIVMSFINFSVADCISSIVNINDGIYGYTVLISAMVSVIVFALVALFFGIPTSETHALTAGLTGAAIAIYGVNGVNFKEWINVIIGLAWSILGTLVISLLITIILKNYIQKISEKKIKSAQIISTCGMSFMHGAQDGQKFIGILIIFICLLNKTQIPDMVNPINYIYIIIFTAIVMAIGVSIGGKKIVQNIGNDMVKLNIQEACLSDITTVVTLLCASLFGLPVSTTHAKTISIIGVAKCSQSKFNVKKVIDICKTWIFTFPICGIFSYVFAYIIIKIVK